MAGIHRYLVSGYMGISVCVVSLGWAKYARYLQCKCSIPVVSWDGQSISGVCTYSVSGYMRTYCSLHMCSIPLGWDSIPVVSKEYPGMSKLFQVCGDMPQSMYSMICKVSQQLSTDTPPVCACMATWMNVDSIILGYVDCLCTIRHVLGTSPSQS